jgi:hypothetical protein
MTTRRILWTLAAIIAIAVIARSVYWMATPRVRVFITNEGSDALQDVTIRVTGASYDVGDLPVAETKQVRVRPTGESFMAFEFTDKRGKRIRATGIHYLESSHRGELRISLKDDELDSVTEVTWIADGFLP